MSEATPSDEGTVTVTEGTDQVPSVSPADNGGRQWRSLWRIHFYSGMFALPFILLMSVTGLVILYTDPINEVTHGDVLSIESTSTDYVSFDEQAAAVEAAFPDGTVLDLTPPAEAGRSTRFFVDDGSPSGLHVHVDPTTAEVLGTTTPGGGIVGLSNRLHGYLNNDAVTVPLPAVSALWDDEPVIRDYVLGDLILEILGVWTLVLIGSGLYLFWPRRSVTAPAPRVNASCSRSAGQPAGEPVGGTCTALPGS